MLCEVRTSVILTPMCGIAEYVDGLLTPQFSYPCHSLHITTCRRPIDDHQNAAIVYRPVVRKYIMLSKVSLMLSWVTHTLGGRQRD